MNGEQRHVLYFACTQNDLKMCIVRMLEGMSSLDAAHLKIMDGLSIRAAVKVV